MKRIGSRLVQEKKNAVIMEAGEGASAGQHKLLGRDLLSVLSKCLLAAKVKYHSPAHSQGQHGG